MHGGAGECRDELGVGVADPVGDHGRGVPVPEEEVRPGDPPADEGDEPGPVRGLDEVPERVGVLDGGGARHFGEPPGVDPGTESVRRHASPSAAAYIPKCPGRRQAYPPRSGPNAVAAAHRPTPELPEHLRALYDGFPFARSVPEDPVSCLQPFRADPRAAEVGGSSPRPSRSATRRRFAARSRTSCDGPTGTSSLTWSTRRTPSGSARLDGFRHRWIRGDQMAYLAARLHDRYAAGETLETAFAAGHRAGGFASGLDALATALRGDGRGDAPPGYRVLFPSPLDGPEGPCKRMTLFVRWMVRTQPPDLGVWTKVPPSELRIPLDQHTYWIAYHLGLTSRRTRSWRTVEEVTAALRLVDALDPVKYDFVLCHTGISGDCPKHRDLAVCGPCVVRPDCRLWRGRKAA